VARRSGQTARFVILKSMTQLLAPILTFTAEEVWAVMPAWQGKEASIHMTKFPLVSDQYFNADLGERWKTMIDIKAEISKAIEQARKDKVIGHSLDARVSLAAPEKMRELLKDHLEDLRALLIVSQLKLVGEKEIIRPYASEEIKGLSIGVEKASGAKCERCWIYSDAVGANAEHPTVCDRCLTNL
jgi:isoleucyl-tRNA synthetase